MNRIMFLCAMLLWVLPPFRVAGRIQCPPAFVWHGPAGACVQEICPADSIGRDRQGNCICSPNKRPVTVAGELTACESVTRGRRESESVATGTRDSSMPPPKPTAEGGSIQQRPTAEGSQAPVPPAYVEDMADTAPESEASESGTTATNNPPAGAAFTPNSSTSTDSFTRQIGIAPTTPTTATLLLLIAAALAFWLSKAK